MDREVQGNCHDPNSWVNSSDKPKLSRHQSILQNSVGNSPRILNASDPWMWHSDLAKNQTVPYGKNNQEEYRERIRKLLLHQEGRTIYFVRDSLTWQCQRTMKSEIVHVLGISDQKADKIVRYLQVHTGFDQVKNNSFTLNAASERDYVVLNLGHHVGNKLGNDWQPKYSKNCRKPCRGTLAKSPTVTSFFGQPRFGIFLGVWVTGTPTLLKSVQWNQTCMMFGRHLKGILRSNQFKT